MRISDWSSDVCSSDLDHDARRHEQPASPGDAGIGIEGDRRNIRRFEPADDDQRLVAIGAQQFDQRHQSGVPQAGISLWTRSGRPSMLCVRPRSEEHTSELQSLMRISYAVFCLKQKKRNTKILTVKLNRTEAKLG